MARPRNEQVERVVYNENEYYKSRLEATKKYTKKFKDVRIRLPLGYRSVIHEVVGEDGSTNAYIRSLIEQAIPDIAERAKAYEEIEAKEKN